MYFSKEMEQRISEQVSNHGNTTFTVMVNHRLVTVEPQNPGGKKRLVYVRYNRSPKAVAEPLEFGIYLSGKDSFTVTPEAKEAVFKLIQNPNVVTLSLDINPEDIKLKFQINMGLKLINIVQSSFEEVFNLVYKEDVVGKLNVGGRELLQSEREELYANLNDYASVAYLELLNKKLLRAVGGTKNALKFYYTFDVFRPMFITGPCVFNPLLEAKRNARLIKNSELFKRAQKHEVHYKDLTIYFMTDKDICESLHFNGGTYLKPMFIQNLLFGLFSDSFANSRVKKYVDRTVEGRVITRDAFIAVPAEERSDYIEIDGLLQMCMSHCLVLGHNKAGDLYNIVSTARL